MRFKTFGALRELVGTDEWQVVETGAYDVMGALGQMTAADIAKNDLALFRVLQSTLATLGIYKGKIDGIFGTGSRASLATLLKEKGLSSSLAPISLMMNLPKCGEAWVAQNAQKIADAIRRVDEAAAAKKKKSESTPDTEIVVTEPLPEPSMLDTLLGYKWWILGGLTVAAALYIFVGTTKGTANPMGRLAGGRRRRPRHGRRRR